jgi:alkylated DNA repair dioxygenase AlkB
MSEPSNKRAITVLDYSSASPQREFSSFADGTRFGSGDETRLLLDVLPKELADRALHELQSQVVWCTMMNRGGDVPRLVSMQGDLIDGCEPVYRHPADEQPQMVSWTPISDELRRAVEAALSQRVNHALIQWYRSGRDWISEHSDKTLDVAPKSVICNLSIGATRVMLLKSKDRDVSQRRLQRIDLPHNSLFVLGLDTNREWRHEIKLDKRDIRFKRPDEIRDAGHRISLTFRLIHTFRRLSDGRLFGGGARVKSLERARRFGARRRRARDAARLLRREPQRRL